MKNSMDKAFLNIRCRYWLIRTQYTASFNSVGSILNIIADEVRHHPILVYHSEHHSRWGMSPSNFHETWLTWQPLQPVSLFPPFVLNVNVCFVFSFVIFHIQYCQTLIIRLGVLGQCRSTFCNHLACQLKRSINQGMPFLFQANWNRFKHIILQKHIHAEFYLQIRCYWL